MRKSLWDKRKFIYLCGVNENKIMDKVFEKLELHIVRLEQAIRQMQRLRSMGIPEEVIEQKTDEYLDVILEIRKEIEKLKEQK